MLIFHHLFIGLMIGAILAVLFSNKWAMIYGGIGGVIPDIIDKPLGQILLADTLNFGRIYAHTLLFAAVLIILGAVIWYKYRQRILLFCLGIGVLLHQFSDTMWTAPINWFWPFLGPFPPSTDIYPPIPEGYLPYLYLASWILAVIAGAAAISILYRHLGHSLTSGAKVKRVLTAVGMILIGTGTILMVKYLIWDLFLTGPWADYFGTMYLHELLSISEWIYGMISIILILVIIGYPVKLPKKIKKLAIKICGFGAVIMSFLLLIGIGLGSPVDFVYDEMGWKILACAGFFVGGAVLLFMEKRLLHLI
ncbi:MAG TPA: metal-dependent hydrolase [Methanocorpusculum sp.]|nr:metal-dependent hydrolase [Methanocorpusculum sp.]